MENIYKTLNGIQTHLLMWGNPSNAGGRDVIVCVTGNPGIPDFYIEFGDELHKNTGFPVCVIGQAGHEEVPEATSNILDKNEHQFNLEGQIKHKLDLITNHIDKTCKLHLIGHSIGSWLVIELLEKNEELRNRVSSINLLFPTVQKMAESRNGVHLNRFLRKIHYLAVFVFAILHALPVFITQFLVSLYLKFNSLPSHYDKRILKYLNPRVLEKVLFLAYDEMDRVTDLNKTGFDNVKHITNIIYGSCDGWVPVSYMADLKCFEPELKMKQVDIDHTFVLKSSERVAEMVLDFIKTKA